MLRRVLLLGAGGAIGRELLKLFEADEQVTQIIATARAPIAGTSAKVTLQALDYMSPGSVEQLVRLVHERFEAIDDFVCASGYLHGEYGQPEKNLAQLQPASLDASFRINAGAPLSLFASCAALLKAARAPRAMFLSAQIGSIEDNRLGGWYAYRMAKAALNMGVRTAAIEAERWRCPAAVVAVHPGTTSSELSRPFTARRKAPLSSPEQTAARLYRLLQDIGPGDNGCFLSSRGEQLPW